MRPWLSTIGGAIGLVCLGSVLVHCAPQVPPMLAVDEQVLREYAGTYQWDQTHVVYLQVWAEFTGTNQLFAFDDTGGIRVLFQTDRDRFFTGPGIAVRTALESQVEFQRDRSGQIASLTWRREGGATRTAKRASLERRDEVKFRSGEIQLAGTLIRPASGSGKLPAIVLVHGSGAEDREYVLPLARFLIQHGIAILGYDKRGVGASTGDWNTASFDDLAGDVVAAVDYLKTRRDIDSTQIGVLGWSQAGWIMPLAALRSKDIAFLIAVSCAGVPAAETTLDQAMHEMTALGMPLDTVEQIVGLMRLQYQYARTGQGWDAYAATREKIAAKMGKPPDSFPGTPDAPYFQMIKRLYFVDPAPSLQKLQIPMLGIFGELDNNILAEKNQNAWSAAIKAGGAHDYTLRVIPKANHAQLEAKTGSNVEMKSLQHFAPAYLTTLQEWVASHVRGYRATP
jgi:pimeloyl-ACP methyl ester carboxylesterase